jgi:prepilin-type N-terminal cleavage/methylation domain-containing protein
MLRAGSKSAFTLIEVLLTITVLAIGMVGVLRSYSMMISAMETAQYNVDAACLLKAKMGAIEEKAIADEGTLPCQNAGNTANDDSIRVDNDYPNNWDWAEKTVRVNIPVVSKEKKEPSYYLNEVTLTMINESRNPARKVEMVTYMKNAKS